MSVEFPSFELPDQDEQVWSRASLLGSRYVVFCYPKDNTSG